MIAFLPEIIGRQIFSFRKTQKKCLKFEIERKFLKETTKNSLI